VYVSLIPMQKTDLYFSPLAQILLFAVGGILFVAFALITSRLIRPNRPNPQKLTSYESGETPQGLAWVQFNMRFYVLALVFLLFEVEIVFLFPWSTVFANTELNSQTDGAWGWYAFTEMLVFIVVLAVGLVYVWKMGHLDWIKSKPQTSNYKSPVPADLYKQINKKFENTTHPKE
jgi:NADH-quinone oxidoreductase subunit A